MTFAGRPRAVIGARDPIVKHLLSAVDASGLSDTEILARAGCNGHALHRLRSGSRSGRLATITDIAEVVGFRVRLEPIGAGKASP